MARYRTLNGVQRPELNDPSVTAGEYNDLVNYPTLTLDEIRGKSIRGRQDLHDQRVQESETARRSGPLAGALRSPTTGTTNAVADNSKSFAGATVEAAPGVQTPARKPGDLTDQSIPWAQRKTANGRTTGLGGQVLESGAVETDQAAQARVLGTGTRQGGVAVRAVGDATPLNEAGSKVAGNPLDALRYSPVQEPAGSPLPVTVYGKNAPTLGASNEAAVAPSTAAQPSVLPAGPHPAEQVPLTPNPPVSTAPTPTATPALGSGGKSVAAGVSNSQAAGFTQPTKDKPAETPTSPVANVDDYDKKANRFSGFK